MIRPSSAALFLLFAGCSSPAPTPADAARDVGAATDVAPTDVARDAVVDNTPSVDVAADRSALVDVTSETAADVAADQSAPTDVRAAASDVLTTVTDATPSPDARADVAAPDVVVADAAVADVPADGPLVPDGAEVPDFMLPDLNAGSRTYRMTVSPRVQRGRISVWYFASAT